MFTLHFDSNCAYDFRASRAVLMLAVGSPLGKNLAPTSGFTLSLFSIFSGKNVHSDSVFALSWFFLDFYYSLSLLAAH